MACLWRSCIRKTSRPRAIATGRFLELDIVEYFDALTMIHSFVTNRLAKLAGEGAELQVIARPVPSTARNGAGSVRGCGARHVCDGELTPEVRPKPAPQ